MLLVFGRKWQGRRPGAAGVLPQIVMLKGQVGHRVKVSEGIWVTTPPHTEIFSSLQIAYFLFLLCVLLQLLLESTARAVFVHLDPQVYHNTVPCIVSSYCPYVNVFSAPRYFILSSVTAAYLITQRCLAVFYAVQ